MINIFAKTPRFSEGYRFIQSSTCKHSPEVVYNYFSQLDSAAWSDNCASGIDWLALRSSVTQISEKSGKAERNAFETLVLVGVNMTSCKPFQVNIIKNMLSEKLQLFSNVVVPQKLWSESKNLILISDELTNWEQDKCLSEIELAAPSKKLSFAVVVKQHATLFFVIFVVFLVFVTLFLSSLSLSALSKGFNAWHRSRLAKVPKNENTVLAIASLSASLGLSQEEFAENLLIEEGLLASPASEISSVSPYDLLLQTATLSNALSIDCSPYMFISESSFPIENALFVSICGTDANNILWALKYRKLIFNFYLDWQALLKQNTLLADLPKEFVDDQPQVFRSILRNKSFFITTANLSLPAPRTPFFRKQDAFWARLLKQHLLGQNASFLALLDAKDKIQREWRTRWQSTTTINQLSALLKDGLYDQIAKNLQDDPSLKRVIEHIGIHSGTNNNELQKWIQYRELIFNGNQSVLTLLATIKNLGQ